MEDNSQFSKLREFIQGKIIGQEQLINRLMIALLADGHLLVEGAPGLAKTRAIQVLSEGIEGDFHRVQFTPDLLPADITGTEVFRPQEGSFEFQQGPLFHNLILADEINRAPAKVQSALLEAMAEHQVTVAGKTHFLPDPFLVMATQNPIEQEGTYHLPEAQLDRFLMHVTIDYPNMQEEQQILRLNRREAMQQLVVGDTQDAFVLSKEVLVKAKKAVLSVHMAENVEEYLLQLVMATRSPERYSEQLSEVIEFGASPRATAALDRCARAHAWLAGKDYVGPEDVQAIAHDVLRHRIILSFEAEADGFTTNRVIDLLLNFVAVP
ncbi:MAG: MoxR-like ATPase in aerotolerance operon [uncultured Thiotrichaceae bacterium]|uniref:MoxR-like ATPase in aerotolerance operon n=1 Tax=uncultured Thiotrichaceae bacterium TaxID=298394 RepID=A0A6S6UEQ8_9GAMM|nr:MAG: MoxR-like ATPase in aerotolerance operon [uncultured Thiotrichaceae bacterium]